MSLKNLGIGQTLVKILQLTDKSVKSVSVRRTGNRIYMTGKVRDLRRQTNDKQR